MHGALRSLIIPCVVLEMALGGSSSLQARDGELAEPSAQVQVQEQPAQAVPEHAQRADTRAGSDPERVSAGAEPVTAG